MSTTEELIRIVHEIMSAEEALDADDDWRSKVDVEIEIERLYSRLSGEIGPHLDSLRAVMKRAESEDLLLKWEAEQIARRRRAAKSTVSACRRRMTDLLVAYRDSGHDPRVKTAVHSYWLQKSTSLEAPKDPADWPEDWVRIEYKPDRRRARECLSNDPEISGWPDGFGLTESEGVRSR